MKKSASFVQLATWDVKSVNGLVLNHGISSSICLGENHAENFDQFSLISIKIGRNV